MTPDAHLRLSAPVRGQGVRKPKEGDTVKAILQFLHAHRIPAWRMNTGAMKIGGRFLRFGAVGMADIIAIAPGIGMFTAIEVKQNTGRVTPAQQAFLNQVNAAGGKAFVARSVADVQRELGLPAERVRVTLTRVKT